MSTDTQTRTKQPNVAASVSGLTHDVIELAELQAQLFSVELKETTQNTRTSLLLGVVGVCILLGTVPVALIALAQLLVEQLGWSQAAGYGVATLVGLAASGAFAAGAYSHFRTGVATMRRSRDELSRNIAWVKSSLRNRTQFSPMENT